MAKRSWTNNKEWTEEQSYKGSILGMYLQRRSKARWFCRLISTAESTFDVDVTWSALL
jgi:hypothetical protein